MLDHDASATPTPSLVPTQVHLERLTEIIALRFGQKVVVSDLHFTPLSGTHQVWECEFEINAQTHTHTERLIVKQLHEHAGQAFSFESTFALQQELFSMGLAAEPIYLSPGNTLWIEAYVSNIKELNIKAAIKSNIKTPSLATPSSTTPEEILVQALAKLHCVDLAKTSDSTKTSAIRQLDPIAECQTLINAVQNTSSSHQAGELTHALGLLLEELAALKNSHNELVLCHNDLHLNHVRGDFDCGGYKCVDWEYAAMGPRYFDLAMCIVINQFSAQQQTQLLQAYAQQTHCDIAAVKQQTQLYVRLAQIINQAWALLI